MRWNLQTFCSDGKRGNRNNIETSQQFNLWENIFESVSKDNYNKGKERLFYRMYSIAGVAHESMSGRIKTAELVFAVSWVKANGTEKFLFMFIETWSKPVIFKTMTVSELGLDYVFNKIGLEKAFFCIMLALSSRSGHPKTSSGKVLVHLKNCSVHSIENNCIWFSGFI